MRPWQGRINRRNQEYDQGQSTICAYYQLGILQLKVREHANNNSLNKIYLFTHNMNSGH